MRNGRIFFGFLRALFWGAIHEVRRHGWREVLPTVGRGVTALWAAVRVCVGKRATAAVVEKRLKACSECPVFCRELQTCGDARDTATEEPMGCYCFMPVKSRVPEAQCWLHDEGVPVPVGWQEASA